ncbi:hypothetical protein TNCV_434971 [Trichonephila clavipes]|nr:hypothetical protein TNCV_434971 [Trichonephila clavipes]
MLVRLSRAPVLSGGLRRKTQLSPVPSTWPPPPRPHLTSPQVLKSSKPAPSARFPRKQSVVSSYQKGRNRGGVTSANYVSVGNSRFGRRGDMTSTPGLETSTEPYLTRTVEVDWSPL